MTNIHFVKWLLVIVYIAAKFRGSQAYQVVFERCEVTGFNKTLGGNVKFKFVKVNRTNFAIDVSFDLYQDMNADLMTMTLQVYKYTSNDYKLYPVSMTLNVCKEYRREFFLPWSEALKHGNIPMCGPMKKGNYYIRDYVPKFNLPNIPVKQGRYKLHGIIRQEQTLLFEGDGYGRIENARN